MAEKKKTQLEEMLQKRQEYKEKTKNVLLFADMPSEKKPGKGRRKDRDYVSDSGGSDGPPGSPSQAKEKGPRKKKGLVVVFPIV